MKQRWGTWQKAYTLIVSAQLGEVCAFVRPRKKYQTPNHLGEIEVGTVIESKMQPNIMQLKRMHSSQLWLSW